MTFAELATYLDKLQAEPSRLKLTEITAELLSKLAQDEIAPVTYLLEGNLLPAYHGLEFQLAGKMVLRAIARVYSDQDTSAEQTDLFGKPVESTFDVPKIEQLFKKEGDVGLVAEAVLKDLAKKVVTPLSISQVYSSLTQLAQASGIGSQEKKIQLLADLLASLDPLSARFVVRIVMGKLRVGVSTMTIIDALSWALTGSKEDRDRLEAAFQKCADMGLLAQTYLTNLTKDSPVEEREKVLDQYDVVLGTPIVPALCQRIDTAHEVIEKMTEVIVEPKYDGLRVQLHIDGKNKKSHAFSRSLEDIGHMFPELTEVIDLLKDHQVILDGEAIGYDHETDVLLAFQQTITRKRKHEIEKTQQTVPIRFYIYDILWLDGKSLLNIPLKDRKKIIHDLLNLDSKTLVETPYHQTTNSEKITEIHDQALSDGLEGVVIKQVDSEYKSGRKGWRWVKMKEPEGTSGKLKDTLDVIVMGYYRGQGKRANFGLGALLVGVFDESSQMVLSIAKIGTGLSEQQLVDLRILCDEHKSSEVPSNFSIPAALHPDVVVVPQIVLEVAADEITTSPMHTAGLALRFPRLIKLRDDKQWRDATTLAELAAF